MTHKKTEQRQDDRPIQITPQVLQELTLNRPVQTLDTPIELADLCHYIWQRKLVVFFTIVIFAFTAIVYTLSLPNIYKSEVLLAPVTEQSGGMAAIASKFGGLASLAGVNLGSGSVDKTGLAIEIIKSRQFISKFINENDLLVPLMASVDWNQTNDELVLDPSLYNKEDDLWLRDVAPPFTPTPSEQEAYNEFKDILSVSQDKDTSLVKISLKHYSPKLAKIWVDKIVTQINLEMKERDLVEAEKSINYIERQLEQVQLAEIKNVLYNIMEEQTKTIMFAKVRDEYVFKTIDPAIVPEVKESPKRALIVVLITLLGVVFALVFLLIAYLNSNRNNIRQC
ncbi:Wzz/FepE/Etk N-terminal domain-containing protein [Thalassotalea aquiviva]|uniref:Wzz/FepE/Etk N-terminal domain-containing protein n=1 Tax=Thalassotalea aquiviva TaxID=3242415 RepID=UPI003529E6B3